MRFFLLLSLLASLFSSCGDDSDACLNDPDCEYFRCKVNGEEWSTNCERDPLFACSAIDVQYYKDTGSMEAVFNNAEKSQVITTFIRKNKLKIGENKFYIDEFIKTRFVNKNVAPPCNIFLLDTTSNNQLFITTLDTINFKLEGTFFLECLNECNENVKITNGNFRVKYRF